MTYTSLDARRQLLDALEQAIDELARALASLGEAYEQLDDEQAERLEERLFGPVQRAYGRAKRTHLDFARRHGLSAGEFATASPPPPSTGVKGLIEDAVDAVARAEAGLVALQDSLMPIEVGDADLRAGLNEVRLTLAGVSHSAREFVRTFGR